MKKIKTFYNGNKPFVIVATAFILLGAIFNDKLINLSNQAAQVFSLTPTVAPQSTQPPYNQYPSLSNSGFYLETKVNGSGNYYQALTGIQSTMTDTAKDIKILISDYYNSGCSTASSDVCKTKLNTILNSLHTYAAYSTAYNKLSYENSNGAIAVVNDNIDWSGISIESLNTTLKNPIPITSVDYLLSSLSNWIKKRVTTSIAQRSFRYISPLSSDMSVSLATFLKNNSSRLSLDTNINTVALFDKSQNSASVILARAWPPVISTFTINSLATNITVKQGSSINVAWSTINTTNCYAMGGDGSGWTGNLKATSPYARPTTGSVTLKMNSFVGSQIFTLNCFGNGGTIEKKLTVNVTPTTIEQSTATVAPASNLVTTGAAVSVNPTSNTFVPATPTYIAPLSRSAPISSQTITRVGTSAPTYGGTISATSNPPVPAVMGPLPPKLYVSPYLFVFGANQLGYTEFKILNTPTLADSVSKFEQINGSLGEVNTTKLNLDKIRVYAGDAGLIYSDVEIELNEANLDTTDYTYYNYTSGSGSGSEISIGSSPSCSLLGIPFTNTSTPGDVRIVSMNSVKVLEGKLVKWANNQSSSGLKPKGEMGVIAVALKNGKVISTLTVGRPGSVDGMGEKYGNKLGELVKKKEAAGCLDFIYHGHTHDIISTSQPEYPLWCCTNYSNNKVVGELVTTPSETDLGANYNLQSVLSPIKVISRVFAPSGNGWEFDIPYNGALWKKYQSGSRYNEITEVLPLIIKARQASMKKNNHPTASQEDDKVGSLVGVGILKGWGAKLTEVIAGK